jgi:fluoride exporter
MTPTAVAFAMTLGVALAAAAGAVARYLLDTWLMARTGSAFPWGTFAVNISGSLALGLLAGGLALGALPAPAAVVLGTGFLGAYTTFSTWMVDSLRLIEAGARGAALANVLGSWAAGSAAAALGWWLAVAVVATP